MIFLVLLIFFCGNFVKTNKIIIMDFVEFLSELLGITDDFNIFSHY